MGDYKLSIIIPTFNSEQYIENTFLSIKNQTIGIENLEIIFIDDNSKDNTFDIITSYSNSYENVKTYKTDINSGFAGKPRNIGLKKSTSEYVLFLDGDDQLLVDACEVLLKNITSNNSDIAIGGHINSYDNGLLEHNPPLNLGQKEIFENTHDIHLLNITPAISAKLFKKELLIKNNISFAEEIPGQDFVFLIESILNSNMITVLNNQYIYFRNITSNSISFKPDEKYLKGLIKAYCLVCDLLKQFKIEFEVQKTILKKHLGFFTSQILRSYHLKILDENIFHNILNSKEYNELASKSNFKNSDEFNKYFKFLSNGEYVESKKLINQLNINNDLNTNYINLRNETELLKNEISQLIEKNNSLKKQNTQLTEQNNIANNKLVDLKKDFDNNYLKLNDLTKSNEILTNENINLKSEMDNIKSSRLWKLRNKF